MANDSMSADKAVSYQAMSTNKAVSDQAMSTNKTMSTDESTVSGKDLRSCGGCCNKGRDADGGLGIFNVRSRITVSMKLHLPSCWE